MDRLEAVGDRELGAVFPCGPRGGQAGEDVLGRSAVATDRIPAATLRKSCSVSSSVRCRGNLATSGCAGWATRRRRAAARRSHGKGDPARAVVGAVIRVAVDPRWRHALERPRREANPHSAVDLRDSLPLPHQRAQRTGRRFEDYVNLIDLGHGSLEAEAPNGRAHALGTDGKCPRGPKPGGSQELIRERHPDLAQSFPTRPRRQSVQHETDDFLVVARRKLDRPEQRLDRIGLCRPAGSRAHSTGPARVSRSEETRVDQALEAGARDVTVNSLRHREIVDRHWPGLSKRVRQHRAQLWVTHSREPIHL
jgi:hypothetical protein